MARQGGSHLYGGSQVARLRRMNLVALLGNPRRAAALATAAVLLVEVLKWAGEPDRDKDAAPALPSPERTERAPGSEATPGAASRSGFDELPSRSFPSASGDPFLARSTERSAARPLDA